MKYSKLENDVSRHSDALSESEHFHKSEQDGNCFMAGRGASWKISTFLLLFTLLSLILLEFWLRAIPRTKTSEVGSSTELSEYKNRIFEGGQAHY
jgi:hypothetical protein